MEQKTSTERADVDNLAAAVLDALEEHVQLKPAGDMAVKQLLATKREARNGEDHGAHHSSEWTLGRPRRISHRLIPTSEQPCGVSEQPEPISEQFCGTVEHPSGTSAQSVPASARLSGTGGRRKWLSRHRREPPDGCPGPPHNCAEPPSNRAGRPEDCAAVGTGPKRPVGVDRRLRTTVRNPIPVARKKRCIARNLRATVRHRRMTVRGQEPVRQEQVPIGRKMALDGGQWASVHRRMTLHSWNRPSDGRSPPEVGPCQ